MANVGLFDVSNGRAALSGSFINVRAPNFLQPKTSLSSCRRPLPFELFSKKRQLALVPSCRAFSRSTRCSFYWEKMDYLPHRHTDPFWGIFWVLECIFIFTTELVGMRNELTLSTYGQQITYPLHGKRAWPGSSVIIRRLQHCSWSRAWTNKSLSSSSFFSLIFVSKPRKNNRRILLFLKMKEGERFLSLSSLAQWEKNPKMFSYKNHWFWNFWFQLKNSTFYHEIVHCAVQKF